MWKKRFNSGVHRFWTHKKTVRACLPSDAFRMCGQELTSLSYPPRMRSGIGFAGKVWLYIPASPRFTSPWTWSFKKDYDDDSTSVSSTHPWSCWPKIVFRMDYRRLYLVGEFLSISNSSRRADCFYSVFLYRELELYCSCWLCWPAWRQHHVHSFGWGQVGGLRQWEIVHVHRSLLPMVHLTIHRILIRHIITMDTYRLISDPFIILTLLMGKKLVILNLETLLLSESCSNLDMVILN